MDARADLLAPCDPAEVFAWVDDLSRYPSWMRLVHRADAEPTSSTGADPAWAVELRGRLGPFARSKRLRMLRTACDEPNHVRFERREVDGRRHSPWVLDVQIRPATAAEEPARSKLEMSLHYGGRLWSPLLERLLHDEIERGRDRLLVLLSSDV